jgi:hypothetical protein
MRKLAIALAAVLALPPASHAQSADDREGVRRAALDYLEGFYEGDSTKHVRSIRPEVYKYGFWIPRDSTKYSGEQMKWPEFHDFTRRVRERRNFAPATAPKEVVVLDVLDQIANAKVTAWWGVDYLLMAKYDGKWMITHVLWQTPPKKTS